MDNLYSWERRSIFKNWRNKRNLNPNRAAGELTSEASKPGIRNSKLETRNSKLETQNPTLDSQYVWALKDINLEINQGDVVGIIGKNGAGKSTLLKILSRITKPTTGSIKYNGRIASLLEVGTGFHPEMTGRENIYMNGAIMGMSRTEITSKLDEIIDFAGVERYIDTPVKRYSSGMTVRLGFSIAAHLEPDILVVDEVLAVGDAEFQKKAIGKMQDVSKGYGRTVLFVSHNMAAVKNLCSLSVLLENGLIKSKGKTDLIIEEYLNKNFENEKFNGYVDLSKRINKYYHTPLIESLEIRNINNKITNIISAGVPLKIQIKIKNNFKLMPNFGLGIYFYKRGEKIAGITSFMGNPINDVKNNIIQLETEPLRLIPDAYQIELVLAHKGVERLDHIEDAANIIIAENDVFGNGEVLNSALGHTYINGIWKIPQI